VCSFAGVRVKRERKIMMGYIEYCWCVRENGGREERKSKEERERERSARTFIIIACILAHIKLTTYFLSCFVRQLTKPTQRLRLGREPTAP
jgi:hypothetical protein